jgi:hypothetical protein
MRDLVVLFVHLIVTFVRLARPGGLRSVVAESMFVKHQLRILNRGRKRAPNLRAADRIIAGLCTLFIAPDTRSPFRHCSEDFYSALSLQRAEKTKVPLVVHAQAQASAWPARTEERTHRRRRCHETA